MGEGPVRRTSCSLGWWCRGATKKGEVLHVLKSRRLTSLIDVRLLPPSTIKAQRRHQSHDLLDSRHLSLWCGVIKGSRGFGGDYWLSTSGTFLLLYNVILVLRLPFICSDK